MFCVLMAMQCIRNIQNKTSNLEPVGVIDPRGLVVVVRARNLEIDEAQWGRILIFQVGK